MAVLGLLDLCVQEVFVLCAIDQWKLLSAAEFRKSPLLVSYGLIQSHLWRQEVFLCFKWIFAASPIDHLKQEVATFLYVKLFNFDPWHQEVSILLTLDLWSQCLLRPQTGSILSVGWMELFWFPSESQPGIVWSPVFLSDGKRASFLEQRLFNHFRCE